MDECGRCWKCLEGRGCIHTIVISAEATPTRLSNKSKRVAPRQADPAWERGIAQDHRGMPYLRPDMTPMGVKEAERERSKFESRNRLVTSTKPSASTKE